MPAERVFLEADNIDEAAEQIIHFLEDLDEGRDVIYLHGCFGWGASAVLKAVTEQLRLSSGSANTGTTRGLEKIIHIDFSLWQSKRALQRAIAEELELPLQVMALFDQYDEEDDFDGVEQSARGVIPRVKVAIMNELMARRFLVFLHNGSGSYIDLWEAGVPVIGQSSKRVLWTSGGRFWHHAKEDGHGEEFEPAKLDPAKLSDVAIFLLPSSGYETASWFHLLRNLIYAEAKDVATYTGVPEPYMTPEIVMECILYRALLRGNDHNINWESHVSNYWVCDGIMQAATDGGRSAWEIGNALQRNMKWDLCNVCAKEICAVLSGEEWDRTNRWVSVTSDNLRKDFQVPSRATSFFFRTAATPSTTIDQNIRTGRVLLEASMFENSSGRSSSLRVIHLSYCNFSFSSPPFLSCNNLRFLVLDHCKDVQDEQDIGDGEEKEYHHHRARGSQQGNGACFRNLWVLELSYTDWYWLLSKDMLDLMADLRELHVKGFGNRSMNHLHSCSGAGSKRRSVVKLRVVADDGTSDGDRNEQPVLVASSFPDLSSWHTLKTVIMDGCGDLELIAAHNSMPLSLESFTLISDVATKIKSISFQGCTKLESLILRGLFRSLVELDMSGTSVKTLDLSATQAMGLKRVFLLGCKELCAILWPQEEDNKEKQVRLEVVRIDTTTATHAAREGKSSNKPQQKEATTASDSSSSIGGSSSATTVCGKEDDPTLIDSDSYISTRNPRFFRSLLHLRHAKRLQVEISSTTANGGHSSSRGGGDKQQQVNVQCYKPAAGNMYVDDVIIGTTPAPTSSGSSSSQQVDCASITMDVSEISSVMAMKSMWLWHCPPAPIDSDCANCYIITLQDGDDEARVGLLPHFVSMDAKTLHLHDSLSITCLPGPVAPADLRDLQWETLEWCRLERCPNLEGVVFTTYPYWTRQDATVFFCLKTFWASQLPKARYIWDWSALPAFRPAYDSFQDLVFLHLDYCPRLVHVFPLYASNTHGCRSLETLEIVCCTDLRVVFPSDPKSQQQQQQQQPRSSREFPALKRIHLYDLPKLQRICGHSRMLAPNLETLRIRGCWGVKRLPSIGGRTSTPPVVDCEKDWWNGLEWDGEAAGHHPSHYETMHSAYYKKTMLRASVLR